MSFTVPYRCLYGKTNNLLMAGTFEEQSCSGRLSVDLFGDISMKMLLKDGKRKVITLSYDDGVIQDKRLVETLNKYGLKGTFNINTGRYYQGDTNPEKGRMTKASAISLFKNTGHEVAVHGYTHPFLDKIESSEIIYEIIEDRKNIEKDYGTIARGMAYPFGRCSEEIVDILRKCQIVYARTTKNTYRFDFPENWLMLHPTCHHKSEKLMDLAKEFVEKKDKYGNARMFYLWGHSFEFDNNDNWDVIEQFAEYVSGRDDIWYATNIEIYDYVEAYKRLQTGFDKTIVHNPSSLDVWVEIRDEVHCIGAGQTLVL